MGYNLCDTDSDADLLASRALRCWYNSPCSNALNGFLKRAKVPGISVFHFFEALVGLIFISSIFIIHFELLSAYKT
jgi:hypothetical protein